MFFAMKREGQEWEPHKEKQVRRREGQRGKLLEMKPSWGQPHSLGRTAWLAPSCLCTTGQTASDGKKRPLSIRFCWLSRQEFVSGRAEEPPLLSAACSWGLLAGQGTGSVLPWLSRITRPAPWMYHPGNVEMSWHCQLC